MVELPSLESAAVFAIAQKADQFSTYILSDHAAGSAIHVVPERGGIITRWRVDDQDLLYLDAERFADPSQSIRGGIPILFPICGNLPNNTFHQNGKAYTLKQHGFARDLPWQVSNQNVQGSAQITLVLNSNDTTRAVYPFDFQLAFTYELRGLRLTITQRVTNTGEVPLPFSLGLHPYFAVQDKSKLGFEIPGDRIQDQNTQAVSDYTGFDFSQDEIDVAFRPLSANQASATDKGRGTAIALSWDEPYNMVVFWTVQGKDYYCLEPWSAPRNALNTGEDLTTLPPHETLETQVSLLAAVAD